MPVTLPCTTMDCPYEYDRNPERDIEGMPFVDDDPRSCPHYGHICPEFMEDFGLTVEDLKIRSLIHCASVMKNLVDVKQVSKWSWRYFVLWREMRRVLRKYPPDKFPHYYRPVWRPDEQIRSSIR